MTAVKQRLEHWFLPPDDENPAATLRWVRRIALAMGAINLLLALERELQGALSWPFLVGGVLMTSSWVTLTPAIRNAERRQPGKVGEGLPPPPRADRATYVICALYCLTFPIPGFLVGGVGGAVFFETIALLTSVLSIWLWRRHLRR